MLFMIVPLWLGLLVWSCGRPGATMRAMRVIGRHRMAKQKGKGGRVTVIAAHVT